MSNFTYLGPYIVDWYIRKNCNKIDWEWFHNARNLYLAIFTQFIGIISSEPSNYGLI